MQSIPLYLNIQDWMSHAEKAKPVWAIHQSLLFRATHDTTQMTLSDMVTGQKRRKEEKKRQKKKAISLNFLHHSSRCPLVAGRPSVLTAPHGTSPNSAAR